MWVGHRVSQEKRWDELRRLVLASAAGLLFLWPADGSLAQQAKKTDGGSAAAAAKIADIFSQVGDQIYEDCIFELSQEQLDVQQALIQAYIQQGADGALARQLAVKQIQPPKLSAECEQVRRQPQAALRLAVGDDAVGAEEACRQGQAEAAGRASAGPRAGGAVRRPRRHEGPAAVGLRAQRRLRHHQPQRLQAQADGRRDLQSLRGRRARGAGGGAATSASATRSAPGRMFVVSDDPTGERQDDRLGDLRPRRLPQQSRSQLFCRKSHRSAAAGRIFLRGGDGAAGELGTEDQAQRRRHLAAQALEQGPVQPSSRPKPSWRAATSPSTCA